MRSAAETPAAGLPVLAPGTVVKNSPTGRWNRVVLLAKPRLTSGKMDMIPGMIKDMVGTFVLTMMATVEAYDHPESDQPKFRLQEVGVGFSTDLDGQLTVLSSESQKEQGANLGFMERRMLQSSEEQLSKPRLVAKTSTLLIFDTPAILFREGEHRNYLMRHFIWVDANSGQCSMLVWLLDRDVNGSVRAVGEPMRWVPEGTKEDRRVHVDSGQFVLGVIPPESAFALEDLPPGASIAWTESAARLAALPSYSLDSIRELANALNEAMRRMRSATASQ